MIYPTLRRSRNIFPHQVSRAGMSSHRGIVAWRLLSVCMLFVSAAIPCCYGQGARLIDVQPFDVIVLNEQNQNQVLKVLPIDLPGRKLPRNPAPTATLRVRLVTNPTEELDVSWGGIARVQLFEQQVMAEARKLLAKQQFDEAFEYMTFVHDRYPETPGLDQTVDQLLYAEASSLYRQGKLERALLLLDEIYHRSPDRRGLSAALKRVLDRTFDQHLKTRDYQQARRLYELVESKYSAELGGLLRKWRQRLESLGERVVQEMQDDMESGRWRDAYVAGRRVLEFWPSTPGAADLMKVVSQKYPLLRVGVLQAAPTSLRNCHATLQGWSARRAERLRMRRLFELKGVGPDGGQYACNVGTSLAADNNRSITIQVTADRSGGLTGVHVAQMLLRLGNPTSRLFDPLWAALIDRVGAKDVTTAEATFRRPSLRPVSLLVVPLDGLRSDELQRVWRPYLSDDGQAMERRFLINPDYVRASATQPREIVEQVFRNPQRALRALRRGEVDMVDRLFPADVAQLSRDPRLVVKAYRVPTIHVLIPNYERPYVANRLFRRGLLYAIDRDKIVHRDLLAGSDLPGCQVVSGPFSPGVSTDDPMAYGYDRRLKPRAYDPRHAKTLMQLAQVELAMIAEQEKETAPSLVQLVLAHPDSEIARVVCAEIAEDLKVIGLPCSLRVLKPGECRPEDGDWDLLYADYTVPEPLVDAGHLLASHGFVGSPNPHLNLALRQLERVDNWSRAGERLQVIHQICFDDTTVLPLWQLVEHMAYRKGIEGIVSEPVSTYQDIEAWRLNSSP